MKKLLVQIISLLRELVSLAKKRRPKELVAFDGDEVDYTGENDAKSGVLWEQIEKSHRERIQGYKLVRAKFYGGKRALSNVDTVVIHRLSRGNGKAGTRYVSNPGDGRKVSWHFTVYADGTIVRHLDLDTTGWHCGYPRGTNSRSIGIEIYGPFGSKISSAATSSIRLLILSIKRHCKNLKYAMSHEYLDQFGPRGSRRDPGKEFDHKSVFSGSNLELFFDKEKEPPSWIRKK